MLHSIRLLHPCPQLKNGKFYGYDYFRTLTEKRLLINAEAEPTDEHDHTSGSSQNDN